MSVESGAVDVARRFKPARIPFPAGVNRRHIYWRYAFAVGGYHVLALLAFFPWFFSWTGVALAFFGVYFFGCIGINLCYHRLLSHRSFRCAKWTEYAFALVGWLFIENKDLNRVALYDRYARDMIRDRFYVFVERAFVWIVLLQWVVYYAAGVAAGQLLGWSLMESVQFGASVWLWGVVVRTIGVWHVTWSGNSFPHLWGYRNYETNDNSRNNILVAIITSGEGFHNNHHADPNSASNGHRWWEIDLTYLVLRVLVLMGVAWDVILPKSSSNAQATE
jgi:stearoyl-CoA desaturase (delta-9 desaturase)